MPIISLYNTLSYRRAINNNVKYIKNIIPTKYVGMHTINVVNVQ